MKIVILTDTHLKEDNIEINISIYRQTIQYCLQNNIKRVFHLGDVFNSRKSQSLQVLNTFLEILDLFQQKGIQLIVIPGNHDKTHYDEECSFLDVYREHPSLQLITTFECLEEESVDIHLLPFFSDSKYNEYLQQLQCRIVKENTILFTHIGVEGAKMSNGEILEGVSTSQFKNYKQVYIGHYHDSQQFKNINYVGASLQHNFGETPYKGLVIINEDFSTTIIELDFPKYEKFELDVKDYSYETYQHLKEFISTSPNKVKIILTGDETTIKTLDKKQLLEIGCLVSIKTTELRQNEVIERVNQFSSSSIREQFSSFCKELGLDEKQGCYYLDKVL